MNVKYWGTERKREKDVYKLDVNTLIFFLSRQVF